MKGLKPFSKQDIIQEYRSLIGVQDYSKKMKVNERSLLASELQSIELFILQPVIELSRSSGTNGFTIMLWQHDGFSVCYHDKTKREKWRRKIREVVNRRASRFGTELE